MWTNQDEMFSESGIEGLSKADKKAIELLDDLACKIVDGDISVNRIDIKNKTEQFFNSERMIVGKRLEIEYDD